MIGSRETCGCNSAAALPARSASKRFWSGVSCCKGTGIEYRPKLPSAVELCGAGWNHARGSAFGGVQSPTAAVRTKIPRTLRSRSNTAKRRRSHATSIMPVPRSDGPLDSTIAPAGKELITPAISPSEDEEKTDRDERHVYAIPLHEIWNSLSLYCASGTRRIQVNCS